MISSQNKSFVTPPTLIKWETSKSSIYERRKISSQNNQITSAELIREHIVLTRFDILVKPTPFSKKSNQHIHITQNETYLNPKVLADQGIFFEVTSPSLPGNSPLTPNSSRRRYRSVTKNPRPGILKKEGSSRFSQGRKNNRSVSKSRVIIVESEIEQ